MSLIRKILMIPEGPDKDAHSAAPQLPPEPRPHGGPCHARPRMVRGAPGPSLTHDQSAGTLPQVLGPQAIHWSRPVDRSSSIAPTGRVGPPQTFVRRKRGRGGSEHRCYGPTFDRPRRQVPQFPAETKRQNATRGEDLPRDSRVVRRVRAKPSRAATWWPQRDSNPCFSHDHVFAKFF